MSLQPPPRTLGNAPTRGRDPSSSSSSPASGETNPAQGSRLAAPELRRSLAEVKGQAQFLLYLADQIEESLEQLGSEADVCHGAFLCKILSMYSSQLETKHQGLGDRIAETCQELYVTVREHDPA
jgi:hypothetical protein